MIFGSVDFLSQCRKIHSRTISCGVSHELDILYFRVLLWKRLWAWCRIGMINDSWLEHIHLGPEERSLSPGRISHTETLRATSTSAAHLQAAERSGDHRWSIIRLHYEHHESKTLQSTQKHLEHYYQDFGLRSALNSSLCTTKKSIVTKLPNDSPVELLSV